MSEEDAVQREKRIEALRKLDPVDEMNEIPHVKRFIEEELKARYEVMGQDDEPTITFSVRVGATAAADLENLGAYLGIKKTVLAADLLRNAIQDAVWGAMMVERENGRLEHLQAALGKRVEFESGGSVESDYGGGARAEGDGR